MIGFMPSPKEDELAYSWFARYYHRTGYTSYRAVGEDLFIKSYAKPSWEYFIGLKDDAICVIKEKANTLLNLCELKLFLSGSGDEDSIKYVSGMVGQFDATKMSYKYGVFGKRDSNYSDERRDVVEAKDLMELREKGECIAFIYGHYVRCKKLRYFEDAYLSSILNKRKPEKGDNKL